MLIEFRSWNPGSVPGDLLWIDPTAVAMIAVQSCAYKPDPCLIKLRDGTELRVVGTPAEAAKRINEAVAKSQHTLRAVQQTIPLPYTFQQDDMVAGPFTLDACAYAAPPPDYSGNIHEVGLEEE